MGVGIPRGPEKQCLICSTGSFSERLREATQVNLADYNKSRNESNKGGSQPRDFKGE